MHGWCCAVSGQGGYGVKTTRWTDTCPWRQYAGNVDAMAKWLRVTSLGYLAPEGLVEAATRSSGPPLPPARSPRCQVPCPSSFPRLRLRHSAPLQLCGAGTLPYKKPPVTSWCALQGRGTPSAERASRASIPCPYPRARRTGDAPQPSAAPSPGSSRVAATGSGPHSPRRMRALLSWASVGVAWRRMGPGRGCGLER